MINFLIKKSVISYDEQKRSSTSIYSSCVPGTRLSCLCELLKAHRMLSACHRGRRNHLERLRNLSEVTQLVCGRQGSVPDPVLVDTTKTFRRMNYICISHYILGLVSLSFSMAWYYFWISKSNYIKQHVKFFESFKVLYKCKILTLDREVSKC